MNYKLQWQFLRFKSSTLLKTEVKFPSQKTINPRQGHY